MNIDFNYKLFNPNFHHIMKCLGDSSLRYVFCYGGSSSSKTYSIVQAIIITTLQDGCNSLIFRKVQASIKKTIYNDFVSVINSLHLQDFFDIQTFQIKCKNGAIISFMGLDDPEKVKGISSYKRIVVDEITECELEDFNQLRKRMRGVHNQKLILTFNPISDVHWLKTEIYDKLNLSSLPTVIDNNMLTQVAEVQRDKNYIFIRSTYLNNYWVVGSPIGNFGYIDMHTLNDFEFDKNNDINFYNIYALGHWGKLTSGGEFYKQFKSSIHISKEDLIIDLNHSLHISFDENVRPYMPMTINQYYDNIFRVVDEITASSPNNNIQDLIRLFVNKYSEFKNKKIYVYGDATSRKQDARVEKGYNLYMMIINQLEENGFTDVELRVPSSNPSVAMSGTFINRILSNLYPFSILISRNCKETIKDFLYLKEDKDGTILKERGKASDGTSYEKYGHLSDSVRYNITKLFYVEYQQLLNNNTQIQAYTNEDIYDNYIEYNSDFISF
jgi:phage terminase large subunit